MLLFQGNNKTQYMFYKYLLKLNIYGYMYKHIFIKNLHFKFIKKNMTSKLSKTSTSYPYNSHLICQKCKE